jgi:DNA polymerase III subunit epsilon
VHPLITIAQLLGITRPLVCLDVETTGKVVGVDRIIQIGVARVHPQVEGAEPIEPREWSSLVDPQLPIPMEASHVHKISNEQVAGAPTWASLAGMLVEGLSGCDFIGQNVKFDLRFLEAEFARVGRSWSYEGAGILDTKRIDEILAPRTLAALVKKYLGEEITDAHEALADVQWTVKVLRHMLANNLELPMTVQALHELLWPIDPSWVDATGRIVWRNSEAALAFGKHNGWTLRQVPSDYLWWVVNKSDQPEDTKQIIRDALSGRYPIKALAQEAA